MATVLIPDETIEIADSLTVTGGETAHEVVIDESLESYVSGSPGTLDELVIGLSEPGLVSSVKGISLSFTYRRPSSFLRVDLWQDGSPLYYLVGSSPNAVTIFVPSVTTPTELTRSFPWPIYSDPIEGVLATLENLSVRFYFTGASVAEFALYELPGLTLDDEVHGYDDPPPPIPDYILTPPRRPFVYPY